MVQILSNHPNFIDEYVDNADEKFLLTKTIGNVLEAAPVFKALVEKTYFPADQIKESTIGGISWLAMAAKSGHVEAVEHLIAKGFNIDEYNKDKVTPLMEAVENGNLALVELLLQNGADVAKRDLSGRTAHSYAIKKGIPEIKTRIRKAISVSTEYGFPVPTNFIKDARKIEASAKPAMLIEVIPLLSQTNTFFSEEVVTSSPHCEKCGEKYRLIWQVDFSEVRTVDWIPEIIWKVYTHFYCSADPTGQHEVRFKFSIQDTNAKLQDYPTKYMPAQYHPFLSVPSAHASDVPIS
ncbi:MAG: ankyrin repeat domain-containing protein, partial [Cytophagia bacterium]|nr:ankyrin repeat domain-containing protein [Cytophagia bacterium]